MKDDVPVILLGVVIILGYAAVCLSLFDFFWWLRSM